MSCALKRNGAPSLDELMASPAFPTDEQLKSGPTVVIECIEEIPCNPCETCCPKNAISVGEPITNLPRVQFEKCIACGACVAACPGLAIYIKDYTYSDTHASIMFPFEYLPRPNPGDTVCMVSRCGEEICEGTVLAVRTPKAYDHTAVVTAVFPKEHFHEVVSMRRLPREVI